MTRILKNLLLSINYEKRQIHRTDNNKKGRRLVVFGDSFFQHSTGKIHNIPNQGLSWTGLLADHLNMSLLNYANSGTSLNYSVQMLFHYMETEYDENDTIIFGVTNGARATNLLDDESQGWHSTAWKFIDPDFELSSITKEQSKYFKKDKEFWQTYLTRCMYADDVKNQFSLVQTYLNTMKNDVLVLHSFSDLFDGDEFNLMQIVRRENLKYFEKLNHMSDTNKKLLARQAMKYFMYIGQNKRSPFDINRYTIEK
jgi:hypothetical protein